MALWQLVVINGPSRVYLGPRKSRAVAPTSGGVAVPLFPGLAELERELELELIQSHMTQKPMLRGEVGFGAMISEYLEFHRPLGLGFNSLA